MHNLFFNIVSKQIFIIGSGFSSLSAACYLSKKGYNVSVFEKNKNFGGRARQFESDGFTFDMGPINFMDGINGISVAQTTVAGVHLALVGRLIGIDEITVVGLAATGSALAFAPWNAPRARMFLGDVGSYFLGFLLSATALAAVISGAPVLLVVAPFSLYLLDTATTLALRIARGARITEAHREHAFQRLVTQGRSHIYVSSVVVVACALSSVVVLIADGSGTAIETLVGLVAWAPAIGFVLAGHRAKVGADA